MSGGGLDDAASQRQHQADWDDRLDPNATPGQIFRDGQVERMIRIAVLAEREACAKIAEDHLRWVHQDSCYEEIAAAIRARP